MLASRGLWDSAVTSRAEHAGPSLTQALHACPLTSQSQVPGRVMPSLFTGVWILDLSLRTIYLDLG